MSAPVLPLSVVDQPRAASPAPSRLARFEVRLERAGEWLNPILVKECRQAMKSRQFIATFSLLLICGWLWSIVGIAIIGPDAYYGFTGGEMFFGYYFVLAFPLFVIVPYGAFRSLAGECEDRTFELVSITTLHPRQIVAGKLGSAVMQMIVYFSALSPCLAFTYLLRGIDVLTIGFILTYAFLASVALSMMALLLSTLAREKHWQIVFSVVLIVALLWVFAINCGFTLEILASGIPIDESWFWGVHSCGLLAYGSYFVLFFLAAAAQLTFASENRSTPLRVTMLVQLLLMSAWFSGFWAFGTNRERPMFLFDLVFAFALMSGIHWYAMGTLMVLEQPHLSPRVMRHLPQSFLGRMFLTWFNPGPGTGYMFATSGLITTSVISLSLLQWADFLMPVLWAGGLKRDNLASFIVVGASYVVFYLGCGKLLVGWLRRVVRIGFVAGATLQMVLLSLGTGVPLVMQAFGGNRGGSYTTLQFTNPFWTLAEIAKDRNSTVVLDEVSCLVPIMALLALLLNLPGIIREVRHVRIAAPVRVVAEEEAASE
jgi:hypothetical protein